MLPIAALLVHVFTTTLASRPVGASHVAATLQSEPEYPALHVAVVQTELDEHVSHVPLVSVGHPASQPSVASSLSLKKLALQDTAAQVPDGQEVQLPFVTDAHVVPSQAVEFAMQISVWLAATPSSHVAPEQEA